MHAAAETENLGTVAEWLITATSRRPIAETDYHSAALNSYFFSSVTISKSSLSNLVEASGSTRFVPSHVS